MQMTNFCENVRECVRKQQLQYFGDKFPVGSTCGDGGNETCNRCTEAEFYKIHNATADARIILQAIKKWASCNVTITMAVHLLRGDMTKHKANSALRHDNEFVSKFKLWQADNLKALFHQLILKKYLRETALPNATWTAYYVFPGPNFDKLFNDDERVYITVTKSHAAPSLEVPITSTIEQIKISDTVKKDKLMKNCFEEMVGIISAHASRLQCNYKTLIDVNALQTLSKNMPSTESEILQLTGLTKRNFDVFGAELLNTSRQYAAKKRKIEADTKESAKRLKK